MPAPEPPPCTTDQLTSHALGCEHVEPGVYAYTYDANGNFHTLVRVIHEMPSLGHQRRFLVRRVSTERIAPMPLERLRVSADQNFGTPA